MSTIAIAIGLVAVRADEIDTLADRLPRAYLGEFTWDDEPKPQNVTVAFDQAQAVSDHKIEAVGCATFEAPLNAVKLKFRMSVRLEDLHVEIWQTSSEVATIETNGSYRGTLSADLQDIDAVWTTTFTGRRGRLHLHAATFASCAPVRSL